MILNKPARLISIHPLIAAMALLALLIAPVAAAPPLQQAAPRLPNIIHFVADDVAYDDFSSFGAKDIQTPNIDRLAAGGTKFTSFYAPSSTCTPTRAALMTGCYAQRVGLPTVLFPLDNTGLNDAEITIAELLKTRGYATACIGKWHLGHRPAHLPHKHGFDLFYGIPYPNDHGPERLNNKGETRGFPPMPLHLNEKIIEQPAQLAGLPDRFAERAIQFITENKDKPFFLHLSNIETHTPWLVPQQHQYKSQAGVYGDAVVCFDDLVGRVTRAVEKLGLANDTLILITSDNGPLVHRYPELERIYGHAATVNPARKHVLREGKYQSRYEGGVRVPCIAYWPGKVKAGATNDQIIAGFDFYPTFAKLAGATLPADRILDGKDISPLLLGQAGAVSPHEAIFHYQGYRMAAVRSGPWKLVFPPAGPMNMGRAAGKLELYNLSEDLSEQKNLAAAHPEQIARLNALAEKMRADLGDAAKQMPGANRRPAGKAE